MTENESKAFNELLDALEQAGQVYVDLAKKIADAAEQMRGHVRKTREFTKEAHNDK